MIETEIEKLKERMTAAEEQRRGKESEKRLLQEENQMLKLNSERSLSELHMTEMELMEAEIGLGSQMMKEVPLMVEPVEASL